MTTTLNPDHVIRVPSKVTAGQVQLARFRIFRDDRAGRETPEPIRRIASVKLPTDPR